MAGIKRKFTNKVSTNTSVEKRRKAATATRRAPYARIGRVYTAQTGKTFKRKFILPNTILRGSSTVATTGKLGSASVSLSLYPEQDNWTKIFDQYRITHAKWTFTNVGSASNAAMEATPFIYFAADFDDQNVPPNKQALLNMDNVKKMSLTPGKMVNVNVKPRLATSLYNSGLSAGYGVAPQGTWVDCANTTIPHYGIKYCIDNMLNEHYTIDMEVAIWIEFRGNHV